MAQIIQPPGWPRPRGFAHGMTAPGRILAIGGQIGCLPVEGTMQRGFLAQFVQALDNVIAVLAAGGGQPHHLISMTLFVTDQALYQASTTPLRHAWKARLGSHYPAMVLVEVKGLLEPGALVEMQALAVLP